MPTPFSVDIRAFDQVCRRETDTIIAVTEEPVGSIGFEGKMQIIDLKDRDEYCNAGVRDLRIQARALPGGGGVAAPAASSAAEGELMDPSYK